MTPKRYLLVYNPGLISAADIGKAQEALVEASVQLIPLPLDPNSGKSAYKLIDLDNVEKNFSE